MNEGYQLFFQFSSIKMYFSPLIPLVIDQNETFYERSLLINRLRCTHTQRATSSSAPPQLNIRVFLHMQSNRCVDGTDDCEMVGQRAQQPRITALSLSNGKCWCTWLLKGNGRRLSDCFALSSTQKTLIPPLYTALCIQIIRRLTHKMVLKCALMHVL